MRTDNDVSNSLSTKIAKARKNILIFSQMGNDDAVNQITAILNDLLDQQAEQHKPNVMSGMVLNTDAGLSINKGIDNGEEITVKTKRKRPRRHQG